VEVLPEEVGKDMGDLGLMGCGGGGLFDFGEIVKDLGLKVRRVERRSDRV